MRMMLLTSVSSTTTAGLTQMRDFAWGFPEHPESTKAHRALGERWQWICQVRLPEKNECREADAIIFLANRSTGWRKIYPPWAAFRRASAVPQASPTMSPQRCAFRHGCCQGGLANSNQRKVDMNTIIDLNSELLVDRSSIPDPYLRLMLTAVGQELVRGSPWVAVNKKLVSQYEFLGLLLNRHAQCAAA
jgi:hypothetical protein